MPESFNLLITKLRTRNVRGPLFPQWAFFPSSFFFFFIFILLSTKTDLCGQVQEGPPPQAVEGQAGRPQARFLCSFLWFRSHTHTHTHTQKISCWRKYSWLGFRLPRFVQARRPKPAQAHRKDLRDPRDEPDPDRRLSRQRGLPHAGEKLGPAPRPSLIVWGGKKPSCLSTTCRLTSWAAGTAWTRTAMCRSSPSPASSAWDPSLPPTRKHPLSQRLGRVEAMALHILWNHRCFYTNIYNPALSRRLD